VFRYRNEDIVLSWFEWLLAQTSTLNPARTSIQTLGLPSAPSAALLLFGSLVLA
jgi:hypothetical protein